MLIPKQSSDRWTLRSDGQGLLYIPKTNCKTLGDRAFAHAAPQLWNYLPLDVRNCENISVFKKRLKTFLFNKAYNPLWVENILDFIILIIDTYIIVYSNCIQYHVLYSIFNS